MNNVVDIFGHSNNPYSFAFNGKENDNEINGWQDYGERMYNRLIGRFPTPDPNSTKLSSWSPYLFAGNSPIRFIDVAGQGPTDPQIRSLSPTEISTLLGQGNQIAKIVLLFKIKKESEKTIIIIKSSDIIKASTTKGLEFLKDQKTEINKIDYIALSKGKCTVNLKEGEEDVTLKLPKATVVIKDNASANLSNLKVTEKTFNNYKDDPVVQDISGSIEISGAKATFLGGIINASPEKITLTSEIVSSKNENGTTLETFDTNVSVEMKEPWIKDIKNKFLGLQSIGKKK